MRLQISLPRDTWEEILKLAQEDRRSPRQQIEYLVICAAKGPPEADSENASQGLVLAGADHA
jgi:hypothetical protein